MERSGVVVSTRDVLIAYIRQNLRDKGYDGNRTDMLRPLFGECSGAAQELVHSVQRGECQGATWETTCSYYDMVKLLHDLPPESTMPAFKKNLDNFFIIHVERDDADQWKRCIMCLAYAKTYSLLMMESGYAHYIRDIVDVTAAYFKDKYLDAWIKAAGGWMMMPRFMPYNETEDLATQTTVMKLQECPLLMNTLTGVSIGVLIVAMHWLLRVDNI